MTQLRRAEVLRTCARNDRRTTCRRRGDWRVNESTLFVIARRGVVVFGKTRGEASDGSASVRRSVPKSEWKVTERPELRIVPEELWTVVRERKDAIAKLYLRSGQGQERRPGTLLGKPEAASTATQYLLNGIAKCGVCGGPLTAMAKAVTSAPAAGRVRVWQITSGGRGPRGGQPLPAGPSVVYPQISSILRCSDGFLVRGACPVLGRKLSAAAPEAPKDLQDHEDPPASLTLTGSPNCYTVL
jgi:Recombinase